MNLLQLETDVRDLCPNMPMMHNVGMAMSCRKDSLWNVVLYDE